VTSGKEIWSWKQSEPSSLLAREIHSHIDEGYSRGFHGVTGGKVPGFWDRVRRFRRGATMEVSQQRVSSWIRAAMVARKRCCPIPSQSRIVAGEPAVS